MTRIVPFTRNREAIYDLLTRAKRFHASSSSIHELDIGDLMDRLAAPGNDIGLLACLVKATALTLERHPRLNQHLFHRPWGKYVVDFEDICCNLVILREEQGEKILLPVLIDQAHQRSLADIQAIIRHHRETPLAELPQIQGIQKLKRLPRLAMKAFSYLARSEHRFYRKFFGTYGLSALIHEDGRGVTEGKLGMVSHSVANTCTAFFPCAVSDQPRVVGGQVVVRKTLTMMLTIDHYLVDGHDGLLAIRDLARLLAEPARLGLGAAPVPLRIA